MRSLKNRIIAALSLVICTTAVNAADIEVKMISNSKTGGLFVFEPSYVKAEVNDTIVFVATDTGHNSRSILTPSDAQPWKSPFNKEFRVKMEKEGVYLYICDAHKNMGMVGVVQVGKAVNLEEARKKASEESAAMAMNKDRFAQALDQVK